MPSYSYLSTYCRMFELSMIAFTTIFSPSRIFQQLDHFTYFIFFHDYHLGQWRCWYDFGMGALGDWGAHILDTAHQFLDMGLPTEVNPIYLKDHNPFFYPMSSTILFRFPKRGDMPAVDVTWYDGLDNIPPVPADYGSSDVDPNIPTVAGGKLQLTKLNPGKEIYTKTLTFKGGSHGYFDNIFRFIRFIILAVISRLVFSISINTENREIACLTRPHPVVCIASKLSY